MTQGVPLTSRMSIVQHVDTYADLTSTEMVGFVSNVKLWSPLAVNVRCRAVPGDQGGGLFRWNPASVASPDGGSVLQITNLPTGRWERQFDGALMAPWFGMVADGTSIANGTVSTATPFRLSVANAPALPFAAGQCLKVQSPNTPATGTVRVDNAVPITGTFDVLDTVGTILGHGTSFLTELRLWQVVQCGALYAVVTSITSDTSATLSAPWMIASGLTLKKFGLVGAGTAFTTELQLGQPIFVNGKPCWIVGVPDDTHANIWPGASVDWPASGSGLTLYRATVMSATVQAVTSPTSVVLANMSDAAGWRVSQAGTVRAVYGADNSAACNALLAAMVSQRRAGKIPSSAKHYMFWAGLDRLTSEASGMLLEGDGGVLRNWDYQGAPGWMLVDNTHVTNAAGSVLSFCRGEGLTWDATLIDGMTIRRLSIIGPGYGNKRGFGVSAFATPGGASGSNNFEGLFFGNWGYGDYKDSAFNDRVRGCVAAGCGIGARASGNSMSYDMQTQGCTVGLLLETVDFSHFTGDGQSNMLFAVLMQGGIGQVRFNHIYWENNADNTVQICLTLHMIAGSTTSIQGVTFAECHSGDIFVFSPDDAGGTGVIKNVDDSTSRFVGASVRPRWSLWNSQNNWNIADLSVSHGGIFTLGSAAMNSIYAPTIQFLDASGGQVTPDFALHGNIVWVFVDAGDIHVNQARLNGIIWSTINPGGGWSPEIEIRFRYVGVAPGHKITWDASWHMDNKWTDVGAANGAFASVRCYNSGSGSWFPVNVEPWEVPAPTYTASTNHTDARGTFDENAISTAGLAHVVGTIIRDLQAKGIFK